jgi:hypothetical protein
MRYGILDAKSMAKKHVEIIAHTPEHPGTFTSETKDWLTTPEACRFVGVSKPTLMKYARRLGARKRGATNIFPRMALVAFAQEMCEVKKSMRPYGNQHAKSKGEVAQTPLHVAQSEERDASILRALHTGENPMDAAARLNISAAVMLRVVREYGELLKLSPPAQEVCCSLCGLKGLAGQAGEHPAGEASGHTIVCGGCGPVTITPGPNVVRIQHRGGISTIPVKEEKK